MQDQCRAGSTILLASLPLSAVGGPLVKASGISRSLRGLAHVHLVPEQLRNGGPGHQLFPGLSSTKPSCHGPRPSILGPAKHLRRAHADGIPAQSLDRVQYMLLGAPWFPSGFDKTPSLGSCFPSSRPSPSSALSAAGTGEGTTFAA